MAKRTLLIMLSLLALSAAPAAAAPDDDFGGCDAACGVYVQAQEAAGVDREAAIDQWHEIQEEKRQADARAQDEADCRKAEAAVKRARRAVEHSKAQLRKAPKAQRRTLQRRLARDEARLRKAKADAAEACE